MKENLSKFWGAISGQLAYVIIAVVIVLVLFILAVVVQKLTKNKATEATMSKTKKMALVGMFAAVAGILMFFEIPIPFIPDFYKIDLSEIPVLICGFMAGPVAGVATEFIKIIIKLLLKGTSTAYVGDVANFIVGCAFVIPSIAIYRIHKTRKTAITALAVGTLSMIIVGAFMNAFVLLPAFAYIYGGMPVSQLIAMGTAVNAGITNMFTFVLFAVVPLNLIKGIVVSLITILIYKKISKFIKNH